MTDSLALLSQGTVTSPTGFLAGATSAAIKEGTSRLDLGLLFSTSPCRAAGLFTRNRIKAAPVLLCQEHLAQGKARAVVANSGCANACTGAEGLAEAREMAALAASKLGLPPEQVLVLSTGVIGVRLPMARVRRGVRRIRLTREGGHELAQAIITTDTRTKEVALSFSLEGRPVVVGGVAKGAGMIHPDLATMLAIITTDAAVEDSYLRQALAQAADLSFNMLSIDGDTSTNDTVLLLANGLAGNQPLEGSSPAAGIFQEALNQVCTYLAREIARDGEGATRLIEVRVEGAASAAEARAAARTIASSPLVKAAVHGADPNWGRILAALGRSGARLEEDRLEVHIGELRVMAGGRPLPFDGEAARCLLRAPEVLLRVGLGLGENQATAWGCDLSPEYVTINSTYTT
jgi:glutamate N-acetyltransferase/amino-acid N-acetyltransferase